MSRREGNGLQQEHSSLDEAPCRPSVFPDEGDVGGTWAYLIWTGQAESSAQPGRGELKCTHGIKSTSRAQAESRAQCHEGSSVCRGRSASRKPLVK